jgi:hypothetical protein
MYLLRLKIPTADLRLVPLVDPERVAGRTYPRASLSSMADIHLTI